MAIRPTDTSLAISTIAQNPPIQQRMEEAPRNQQLLAQQQFVAQTSQRNETVAETGDTQGNRIGVRDKPEQGEQHPNGGRRRPNPDGTFEEVVEDAAGVADPPHLIDFTA